MATPTPSSAKRHPTPSSHPASTPHTTTAMTPNSFANHLAAGSPLPTTTTAASGVLRSVASPASYLHPSKSSKSPFNTASGLIPHSHLNSSTPLLVGFASPSTAAAAVGGLGGLNISGLNGTPTATGNGTAATVSLTSSTVNARDNEDERRRRIEAIVAILRQRPGRVSEEEVERLAKRTGLECLWEDGMGGEGDGKKTLSIAGNNVLVDVDFLSEERVEKVGLSFPTSKLVGVVESTERGGRVLQKDLQVGKGEEMGYKMLDPFADNLERLARLDKLSSDGANCYEAVAGVYASLRNLFDFEKGKARGEKRNEEADGNLERDVLCKRSGRPRMHARRRIGLSLEYWMERRLVQGKKRKAEDTDVDMDATKEPKDATVEEEDEDSRIWSAVIECEASSSELYPSIQVSDCWISPEVEKSNRDESFADGELSLDWLEPPPTFTSSTVHGDPMAVDSGIPPESKQPDVRFVARLEPPVVVPLQTAVDIYNSVGITIPQESIRPTTFEELLLASTNLGSSTDHSEDKQSVIEKTVNAYDRHGNATEHKHRNTLYTQKQQFGRLIEEIPFSHPRQLVTLLPILRQWALVGSILQQGFIPNDADHVLHTTTTPERKPSTTIVTGRTAEEELAALLEDNNASPPDQEAMVSVDLLLTTLPTPKIALLFDLRGQLANVVFEILHNAEIQASAVTSNTAVSGKDGGEDDGNGTGMLVSAETAKKALEISEDVGVLVEWVRRGVVGGG